VPIQRSRAPQVVFQPRTYGRIQGGIDDIVGAVRPTLGPCPRLVAIARQSSANAPELLDSGGIIARRIAELPNRDENAGAMLVRHLLWRIYEQVGDGTVTAAVIFHAVYNQSVPYIVAGGSPMRMRRYLERGAQLIRDELAGMVRHVEGQEQLARIAESICHERELAGLLGEIFDIIGEHGQVESRSSPGRGLDREYVEWYMLVFSTSPQPNRCGWKYSFSWMERCWSRTMAAPPGRSGSRCRPSSASPRSPRRTTTGGAG
jgi:chaperonin GroEL